MSDELSIEIDGQPYRARKGAMVIEVADENGVAIPRFCYHRKLSVAANCRMCLVEVEKAPKPLPACATPVADGMKVLTRSPLARRAQRSVMEFLLINHPLDCPVCDQGGECELQDLSLGYGDGVSRFTERKRSVPSGDLGPLVATYMTRCIHCTRCVRFGEEIGGMPELGATGRSEHMEIGTYIEANVDSELSGNIIDLCPVGALTSKPFRFQARAWEMSQHEAIATHDSVGSNVQVHVARRRILRVVPRANEAVNEVWISDRDRFGYTGLYTPDRLRRPMVKRDGRWQAVDLEEALGAAAEGLREVVAEHGAQRLGALASPSATIEELFLLQHLSRGLGSPNIDHRLREADFRDQDDLGPFPWLGQSLEDLETSDAILLVGAHSRKSHPLVNHRLRKATLRGARAHLLNPVDWAFNFEVAGRLICPPPQMPRKLAEVFAALHGRVGEGREEWPAGLLSGLEPGAEESAIATSLHAAKAPTILLGPEVAHHPEGSVLRALAGALARHTGARLGFLPEGANGAGAWIAGALPHRLPGGQPSPSPGLDARAMLAEGLAGFVLLGVEPELDAADGAAALEALSAARFVVSLTGWSSPEMEAYADVLLPMGVFAETSGTWVNLEGRWQSAAGAVAPPGEARPAWKLLRVLGNLLGLPGFEQTSSAEVLAQLREAAGTLEPAAPRGEHRPEALPSTTGDALWRIGDVPIHAVDPLVRRAAPLQQTRDAAFAGLEVAPATAGRLGLADGDIVTVKHNGSHATMPLVLDPRIPEGCARLPSGIRASAGLGPAFGILQVEKV